MKRQQLKMWSFIAAATLFVCTLSAPVYAEDAENLISISADNLSDAPVEEMTIDNVNLKPNDSYYDVYELEMERIENTRPIDGPTLEELQESGNTENLSLEDLLADLGAGSSNIQGIVEGDSAVFDIQTFSVGTDFPEERYTIYDAAGRATAGWMEENGNWYYEKADGSRASGWLLIDGTWYYFETDPTHYMRHGWLLSENKYYFMGTPGSPSTGAMYTYGWMNDTEGGGTSADPLWYYMGSDGVMHHGWLQDGGNWYHMGYPGSPLTGTMYNFGWMEDTNGSWYYFEDDGIMQTGWLYLDQKYYYLNESSTNIGQMAIGSKVINGKTYLFDSLGVCINRNPPSTNNNMTYNFTFYLETEKDPILGAKNSILDYFDKMGYNTNHIFTAFPEDVYATLPYDKISIIHGHGNPGQTIFVEKYQDDNENLSIIMRNWLMSSRNWICEDDRYKITFSSDERVVSDYVANQLNNNIFTMFISCYSAETEDRLRSRSVDRSMIQSLHDAGAQSVLGYQYEVRGGEFYAQVFAAVLYGGSRTLAQTINDANYVYGQEHDYVTNMVNGILEYQSPHDPRNQRIVGDISTVLYDVPNIKSHTDNNSTLLSSSQLYQAIDYTANKMQPKELSNKQLVPFQKLSSQFSSQFNLVDGPDSTINYTSYTYNNMVYCFDDKDRLKSIYTNQKENESLDILSKPSTQQIEEIAYDFLSNNDIDIESYQIIDIVENAIGYQVYFEDNLQNKISMSLYKDGTVSWAIFRYNDVPYVSEADKKYFEEKFNKTISQSENKDDLISYAVTYRKNEDTLYAIYNLSFCDADGLYYCEEMVFGK